MIPTPLSVSVRDAAQDTSLSEYEIRQAINKGELPAVKRGRRIVILRDDLHSWLRTLPRVADAS
jgi:excisionase family DNA binding protein